MTLRNDLQYAQDWDLDSATSGKAEYYAPIMQPPMTPEQKARVNAIIENFGIQFRKARAEGIAEGLPYYAIKKEWWHRG